MVQICGGKDLQFSINLLAKDAQENNFWWPTEWGKRDKKSTINKIRKCRSIADDDSAGGTSAEE